MLDRGREKGRRSLFQLKPYLEKVEMVCTKDTMFNPCVKSPKGSETAEELGLVVSDVLGKESALPEHFYALPPLTIFHFSAPLRASE